MSVPLTGAGSLFVKLGHILGALNDINLARGSTIAAPDYSVTITTKINALEEDYAGGTQETNVADGIYQQYAAWQSAQSGFLTNLSTLAANTVIDMVNADNPQPNKTLKTCLTELIRQMTGGTGHVTASVTACGAASAVGSPNGTPSFVTSMKDGKGLTLQYTIPETITLKVTGDSQNGSTKNQEPYLVTGQVAQSDELNQQWPLGSGASSSGTMVDASQNNAGGTVLVNGDFETFTTTDVPDNWTLTVGVASVDIFNGGAGYTGAGCLKFLGTAGALLDAVTQAFSTASSVSVGAGGSPYVMLQEVPYAFNCWIKCSATPAAGVLEFSLINGAGSTINDDASTANLFTKSLTAVSTTWIPVSGVFRLPALLPSGIKLKMRLSTAIDNGKSVFIDRVALAPMTQIYPGGPFFAAFSGATVVLIGDAWTFAVTNTWGGFQQGFEKMFGMRQLGLRLETAAGAAISDALIV